MSEFVAAVLVFLASHALPALAPLRECLVRGIGRRIYLGVYTLVSVGLFAWLISAYARAPMIEVWSPPPGARWVPLLVMPFACILVVAGLGTANSLSLTLIRHEPGKEGPGIVSVTRHPVVSGLVLWAGSHLAVRGDLAGMLLFGFLTGLGLAGMPSLDDKARRRLGPEAWRRLAAPTSALPFAAALAGRTRIDWRGIGVWRPVGGLLLHGALLALHETVVGVSPLIP